MSEADLNRESEERHSADERGSADERHSADERRSPHVQRVDLTTLVDICVQDGKLSPFQGESANVSGRGMQVRTSYLPEIGEELVCRFEHAGQEILVEGRVAWRAEGEDSGEFGIQFTALDASSAQILTDLGEREPGPRFSAPPPSSASDATKKARAGAARLFSIEDEEEEEESLQPGSRVRLHIDGLGAPMKAAVHDGSRRKVKVGSSLEFLKVGRPLQIEDVQGGQTRGAHVDSVNVVLNPSTSIPELVVMLRYEGMTPTPAPTATRESTRLGAARPSAASHVKKATPHVADEAHDAFADEDEPLVPEAVRPAAEAIRAQWLAASSTAQDVGKKVGSALGSAWGAAREQMSKVAERRRTTAPAPPKQASVAARPDAARRRTTAPPSHLRSSLADAGLRSSRPSMRPTSVSAKAPPAAAPRAGRLMVLSGGAIVLFAGSALLLRSLGGADEPKTSAETPLAAQAAASGAPAPTTPAVAAAPAAPTAAVSPDGIVADVPLFGPKAMATSEAARPSAPTDDATAEKLAAAATVEDEAFAEEPEAPKASEASWGRGRLHLPTIHRIRLDGEGTEVVGALESNGFTVVIPGRKPMESGRSIEKRDRRIVQVKASSTARGASVHFEFRGPVPGYRVRLRKDFVEILVSAPEDGVAAR